MSGLGMAQDPRLAVGLYRAACDGGDSNACNNLGEAYAYGIGGIAMNQDSAIHHYLQSCRGNPPNPTACSRAGARLERREPSQMAAADSLEVRALYDAACQGGSPVGCHNRALVLEQRLSAVPPDRSDTAFARLVRDSVLDVYRDACQAGSMHACTTVGISLQGHKQLAGARRHFQLACDSAWGAACMRLGHLLIELRDASGALRSFRKGCDLLDSLSCRAVGFYGEKHHTLGQNEVLVFYAIGCARGHGESCNDVGRSLENNLQDLDGALRYYRQACRMNSAWGCRNASITLGLRGEQHLQAEYRDKACRLEPKMDICV